MAIFQPTIVEAIQDTPNLVYRITMLFEDTVIDFSDEFTWDIPFQVGAQQDAVSYYRRQVTDPDEKYAVINSYDLSTEIVGITPVIFLDDNGLTPPDPAFRRTAIFTYSATAVDTGIFGIEFYMKWYKQADGGDETFGLVQTSP